MTGLDKILLPSFNKSWNKQKNSSWIVCQWSWANHIVVRFYELYYKGKRIIVTRDLEDLLET